MLCLLFPGLQAGNVDKLPNNDLGMFEAISSILQNLNKAEIRLISFSVDFGAEDIYNLA